MGTTHFPVLLIVLHWLSLGVAINYERMCDTTEHGIKTVKIISHGQPHCLFRLPNETKALKPFCRRKLYCGGRYCFHLDEVRQACAKYKAGLLQLRTSEFAHRVYKRKDELSLPNDRYSFDLFVLGVKHLVAVNERDKIELGQLLLQWDSGVNMTHAVFSLKKFGTKTWKMVWGFLKNPVSYLFVPCIGLKTSGSPGVYTYADNTYHYSEVQPVAVVCQRNVSSINECVTIPVVGAASLVKIGSTLYCIFRPKEEPTAIVMSNSSNASCPGCPYVNMTTARAICALYSALLPQITSGEMFDAVVNATQQIFATHNGSIFLPLGVHTEYLTPGNMSETNQSTRSPQDDLSYYYNVTWDNGISSRLWHSKLRNATVTPRGGDVLFYETSSGKFIIDNPAKTTGVDRIAVVCHQEYPPVTRKTKGPFIRETTSSIGSPSRRSSINYLNIIIKITLAMVVSAFGNISGIQSMISAEAIVALIRLISASTSVIEWKMIKRFSENHSAYFL